MPRLSALRGAAIGHRAGPSLDPREQGAVGGIRVVLDQHRIVHPGEPLQRLPHLPVRVDAEHGCPHAVDDHPHPRRLRRLEQVAVRAQQPREPHRVGRAHGDDLVGRAQGRDGGGVAAGRGEVAAELLVRLEIEPRVDDDGLAPASAPVEHGGDSAGRELGPAVRTTDAGEHREGRGGSRFRELCDPVELAHRQRLGAGQSTGGREPGCFVEQAEGGCDAAAVGVGVDQCDRVPARRQLGSQPDRDGGAARCPGGAPHDDRAGATGRRPRAR